MPSPLRAMWQRQLTTSPQGGAILEAVLWGQSAQSPGVSISRTPKRLGARPETPPIMLYYVSVTSYYL